MVRKTKSIRVGSVHALQIAMVPVVETLEGRRLLAATPLAVSASKLTGTVIGTPGSYNNSGNTIAKAFDSNFSSFFDAQAADGDWVGLDLGVPTQITQVQFAPRASWAPRMVGGVFQGSSAADFSSGVVDLFTVSAVPVVGSFTSQSITDTGSYRYVRYLGPVGSHGNVAELEFDGGIAPPPSSSALNGAVIGTAGSYNNSGNTVAKAFDSNLASFFDAQAADGVWAGLDLGVAAQITQIQYAPRSSWASRMVGGIFQGSSTADFSSNVVNLFTISAAPVVGSFTAQAISDTGTYRYVRYLGPTGSHGNVAEIEFDGITGATPPQAGPKLTGSVIGTAGANGNTNVKVFDFNLNTFLDAAAADGVWAGLDLGAPNVVAQIKYAPRSGQAARMVGGIFQGSDTPDFSANVANLYTVTSAPTVGAWTTVTTGNSTTFRYVRYLGPVGSHGDVAEVEFDNQVTGATPNPSIRTVKPANGATAVARDAFVSCDLNLPNLAAGIDVTTMTTTTVQLYRTFDHQLVDAALNTDGADSVIVLQPYTPLDASTNYTFVVTAGLKDLIGATFQPFTMTFTTGSAPITTNPNIAFEKVALPTAVGQMFTGVTVGPDSKLYATTLDGHIFQYAVNPDGTLGNPFDIQTVITANGGARVITGIAFDPASTPTNMTIWVSHGSGVIYGAADFTGKISTISGSGTTWGSYQDDVVALPRSSQDHLNNQPVFGPDGALYWGQGSNSAMGAPDSVWGLRKEHLLNAAILRLDVAAVRQRIANGQGPLNVQTDSLPVGQTAYNPYAANAPLTIYATGLRNDYDMVFASNGHLYAPTNGSAAGGNVPATPAGVTPSAPAINNVTVAEDDFLFDVEQGGYYGHPNPSRNEWIMDGGNPTTPLGPNFPIAPYPVGINPDPNYRGVAKDLGVHYSPDGVIEYQGTAFNGALDGALLITRYSGGDDILMVSLDSNGDVIQTQTGIAGFTGFNNPIDLTEDGHSGFIYVAELGAGKLTLLRPINSGAQVSVSTSNVYFNDPVGGTASPSQSVTISNTGNAPLALPSDGLTILGTDGSLFPIVTKPALPLTIPALSSITITLAFNPASTTTLGLHTATLQIKTNDPNTPLVDVSLRALATAGLGGNKEPSLQRILDLYQIPVQTGTADPSVTTFTTPPGTPNDEVVMPRLQKAGTGPITITPLAVFSASITPSAGFGYYSPGTYDSKTELFNVGTADAQSVHVTPIGVTTFDPGSAIFGLYSSFDAFPNSNGTARIAYSEDVLNTFDTTAANNRKVRFYPLKNSDGSIVPNAFIFATEDYGIAPSYDSNDVVGIIRNVKAAASGAELGLQNLDSVPFADRLVFNSIQNLNATVPNVFHNSATLRIWNTGDQSMSISSITSNNAFFTVGTFPASIAAGTFADVVVTYAPTHTGNTATDTGTLTITTNAVNSATKTVQLQGFWQIWGNNNPSTGAYTEPTVTQIINLFGYKTTILNAGQNMNQGGRIQTVGEEVLSGYWVRADSNLPVTARQLASFHTQGNKDVLYWTTKAAPTTYNTILTAVGPDGQSILPQSNDTTHAAAYGTFSTTGAFAFNIDKQESSDDTLNAKPTPTDEGHHLRFWPARDRSGNIIPNTWLMSMDYAGINYDYNDNVFLLSNMRPNPPATPTNLAATGSGSGIALTWTAVSAPLLAGYNVYRSSTSGGTYVKVATGVTGAAYNDASAPAGSTSFYKITATDTWGGESAQSTVASAARPADSTPPAAPTGLSALASGTGITLNWADNTEADLAGYNVYRSTSSNGTYFKLNSSPVSVSSYNDTGAPAGQASFYRVTAVDASNNESTAATTSATRTVDTAPPAAPLGFAAVGSTANISLSWSANTETDLAGYNLYRSNTANGTFTKLNSTPLTSLSFTDTGAQLSLTTYYRLTAVDVSGNESTATTANAVRKDTTAPAAPASLAAVGNSANITLSWSANTEADLAGYRVYRAATVNGTYTLLNTSSLLGTNGYVDTAAPVGVASFYHVTAVDLSGNESTASSASATRSSGGDITPPAQPTGFNALGNTGGINLMWAANTEPDLAGYNVYSASAAAGPFTKLNTTGLITGTSYSHTSAPVSKTTYYRLSAVDTSGNESTFATDSALRPDVIAPAAPTNFTATGSLGGVALAWTANSETDLAGYNVYRGTSAAGPFTKLNTAGLVTFNNYNDTGAPVGATSYYQLRAVDTSGNLSTPPVNANAFRPSSSDITPPAQPTNFNATGAAGGITLTWSANTEPDLNGYNVYRSASTSGPFTKLNTTVLKVLTYNDTAAPQGPTSFYRLGAIDLTGNESAFATASAVRPDSVAPATPANFKAVGSTSGIALTWNANTETDLAGYNLYTASSAAGPFTKKNTSGLLTGTSFNDTTAIVGATTFYRLTAVDVSNNESTTPATANALRPNPTDTTPPATPAGFNAVGSLSGIALSWNANTEPDLAGYNLYRGASAGGTFTKVNTSGLLTSTTYNDTAATPGATTFYRLTAVDTSTNEATVPATANALRPSPDLTPPAQPSGFTATGAAGGVRLQWNANTESDLAGYNLYRGTSATGPFTKLNTTGLLTVLSYNDAAAPAGQTSFYRLGAVDTSNNESTAATASADVPAQSGFASSDIGNPPLPGSTTTINAGSDYDMTASGANIFDTADQFRYIYKQVTGDFDVKVQITSLSNGDGTTSAYARAGLMVRTDLTAGSANLYTYTLAGPFGFLTTYRQSAGATTQQTSAISNNPAPQKWVRIVRVGDTFTNYASIDGTTWTQIASPVTVALGQTVYLGMAATSHQTDHLVTAKFRSFSGA